MKISIIAAIGRNRELGKDNKLLWHIPEDFARFKKITSGHPVIMGRKTFESIGKPLPNRVNIIITRDKNYKVPQAIVCHSLEEALKRAKEHLPAIGSSQRRVQAGKSNEVFIIGGASIYAQAIKFANKLYLTLVEKEFPQADTFFPDYSEFTKVLFKKRKSNKKYSFTFLELEKNCC